MANTKFIRTLSIFASLARPISFLLGGILAFVGLLYIVFDEDGSGPWQGVKIIFVGIILPVVTMTSFNYGNYAEEAKRNNLAKLLFVLTCWPYAVLGVWLVAIVLTISHSRS